ncbi:hypothetical protein BH23VER1_BH23VER1_08050 [soil metagenome]
MLVPRAFRTVLAAVFLACVAYLIWGDQPWDLPADKTGWKEDTVRGLYWAAAVNAALALLGALTVPLWVRRVDFVRGRRWPMTEPCRLPFWVLLGLAVVLGGALRWNFAHGSLWWDELWNVRQAVVGNWKVGDEPGAEPTFSRADWSRAAWYYQKPTNHIPATLAAKLSYQTWAAATGAPDGAIAEFPIRFPNYLLSLGSIVAVALLVAAWGFPSAGVVAAFLLALHPWAIRYGIDMRAYSGLVLYTALGCLWITRIAHTCGREWRYWLLFGLNQFLLVWSLPNAVWYAFAFFLALAALVLWSGGRLRGLVRLVVANVFAAMALLAVAGPAIVQAYRWIGELDEPHLITKDLLVTTASQLLFGMPMALPGGRESAGIPTLTDSVGGPGLGMAIAWAVPLLLMVIGMGRAIARSRTALLGLAAVLGATAFYLVFTHLREELFYPRYLIYLLVPAVAMAAIGIDWLAREVTGEHRALALALSLAVGAGCYAWFVAPQIKLLADRSYAPMREVADWIARHGPPTDRRVFGFGLGGRVIEPYIPDIRWDGRNSEGNILNEMAAARAADQPLYVIFGYPSFNRATFPEAAALLDNPARFDELAAFPGIEPEFFFRILSPRAD